MVNALLSGISIGMATAFLWHFGIIARYGSFIIQEPNRVILTLEIALLIGIVIFSTYTFIKSLTQVGK